jgi:hypothetical protein
VAADADSAKGGSVHWSASGLATTDSALFNDDSAGVAVEAAVAREVCGVSVKGGLLLLADESELSAGEESARGGTPLFADDTPVFNEDSAFLTEDSELLTGGPELSG